MFKKKKQEAFKALKGLTSSKIRSKYEFSFHVEKVDGLVAVEPNREITLHYRIRGSTTEGSLSKKSVPVNKVIVWEESFEIQSKFTHMNHKVNKEKLLKIDILVFRLKITHKQFTN